MCAFRVGSTALWSVLRLSKLFDSRPQIPHLKKIVHIVICTYIMGVVVGLNKVTCKVLRIVPGTQ